MERLETAMQSMVDQVGRLCERALERYYRERAKAYLGRWLWPVAAVPVGTLREQVEARLSESQVEDVMQVDVLIRGRARRRPETPEVWLAMEVSAVIDQSDVERARRRAALLREAGYWAVPAVAGERLTEGAERLVEESPIIVVLDGYSRGWEEVLDEEES